VDDDIRRRGKRSIRRQVLEGLAAMLMTLLVQAGGVLVAVLPDGSLGSPLGLLAPEVSLFGMTLAHEEVSKR
jgi:hypothetical protein